MTLICRCVQSKSKLQSGPGLLIGDQVQREELSGSIAVDSQGFIYVADELNSRIQKSAP